MRRYRGNDLDLGVGANGKHVILPHDKRLEHLSIFGLTGTGKSRYLEGLNRQDIRKWPETHCGMLVIDRHGDLFDGLMQWIGANELKHLPVIPIDLSRPDQIISYNVLRRRAAEPSVVIDSFVRAMSYIWGQEGTNETPLFERWATNTLHRLYQEGRTLADAAHLFTRDGLVIDGEIHDPLIRRDWQEARRNWKDFEIDSRSTVNRFRRFLLNPILRAMFGQTETSLDLGQALREGQIILVSLAQRGGLMSPENGDLVATLLLSDLWTAAAEHGKGDHVKPFYCVLDEFQRFLCPSLAENLAEARGFGIGMTMASQHPRQLTNAGPNGVRIYDEVMENARSKVVFRLSSRANLEPMAEQLCMRTLDPYRIKHQHYQTTLVGHDIRYLPSDGITSSDTVGGGNERSHTKTKSHALTDQWSHTDSEALTLAQSQTESLGITATEGSQWNETQGTQRSRGRTGSHSEGGSRGRGVMLDHTEGETRGIVGKRLTEDDAEFDDRFGEEGARQSWTKSSADRVGVNASEGEQWNDTSGWSDQEGESLNRGTGGNASLGVQYGLSATESEAATTSSADTVGGSETFGTSDADTVGENRNWTQMRGVSRTMSPHLIPVLQKEASQPVFLSIEEQIVIQMVKIARLPNRQAYVLTSDMDVPLMIRTPELLRPSLSEAVRDLFITWYQRESGLAVATSLARAQVRERDTKVFGLRSNGNGEPTDYRRKLVKRTPD